MSSSALDLGLLILRLVAGLFIVGHGAQKFGLFGGAGLTGFGAGFHAAGFRPGRLQAALAGVLEVGAGLALLIGLLFPFAAAILVGVMLVACSMNVVNGLWAKTNGVELPLILGAIAAALLFTGPGAISVDGALGFTYGIADVGSALIPLGVVLLGSLGALGQRIHHLSGRGSEVATTAPREDTKP